jgi:heme a synthase
MNSVQRLVWFRRLALAGACLAALVVVLGAWVRLTDAGLGCPDWPGCYGHFHPEQAAQHLSDIQAAFPNREFDYAKAMHEMIHRYFASALGLVIVALCGFAIWNRKDSAQPLGPVIALLVLVCLQGTLGALTVTMLLKPLIVTAHLLGGLTTLSLLSWLARWPERREPTTAERRLRSFAVLGLVVLSLQIGLGGWTSANYAAIACPDFPTCRQSWIPAMDYRDAFVLWRGLTVDYQGGVLPDSARVAIHYTHRIGAIVAGVVLISLGISTAIAASTRGARWAGIILVTAVLIQITIGISTVINGVPLALATAHNAGAALLAVAMVGLLRALWPQSRIRGV